MQLRFRNYQTTKTKSIIKKNKFLLFSIGANQNASNWITLEQNLHKLNIDYIKIYNNTTTKILQKSITKKLKNGINSTFFFLKHKNTTKIIKSNLLNEINTNKFNVISIYLNKKLYSVYQLKKINSYHYKKNMAIMYQFLSATLKSPLQFKQNL
jgi:hypothetical protein